MRYWVALALIVALSAAASASTDIVGKFGAGGGSGFTGRFPLTGGFGSGGPPPVGCGTGTIDASEGCPLPMLGL